MRIVCDWETFSSSFIFLRCDSVSMCSMLCCIMYRPFWFCVWMPYMFVHCAQSHGSYTHSTYNRNNICNLIVLFPYNPFVAYYCRIFRKSIHFMPATDSSSHAITCFIVIVIVIVSYFCFVHTFHYSSIWNTFSMQLTVVAATATAVAAAVTHLKS